MAEQFIDKRNFFIYGEIGERLSGIREAEIYSQSAKELTNFYITELGNLKIAKQYSKKTISNEEVLNVVDTKYNFYLLITTTKIRSVEKGTDRGLYELAHGMEVHTTTNVKIFEKLIMMTNGKNTTKVFGFEENGKIGTSNYLDTLEFPLKDKQDTTIDIYKVYMSPITNKLEPVFLSTFKSPKLKTDGSGIIYMKETNLKLDRIYRQYRTGLANKDITGIKEGMVFGVLQSYIVPENTMKYHIGNTPFDFQGETQDTAYNGTYFTKGTANIQPGGQLFFGQLIDFKRDITDCVFFQNRLVISTTDTLYFSKTFDYNDFKNGVSSDDGFYIKPTVIDNNQPIILRMLASGGIFVGTDRGIYSVGYGMGLTPSNSLQAVRIASDIPTTYEMQTIGDSLYYISDEGILKCLQVEYTSGQLQFVNSTVEKYDIKNRCKFITKAIIDDTNSLVVTTDEDRIFVYDQLDINLFRRYSLTFSKTDSKIFGLRKDLICGTNYYTLTRKNYEVGTIYFNPPNIRTGKSGSYLNDYESRYKRIVLVVLNEDREAVDHITIGGLPTNNLGGTIKDKFSAYKMETSIPVLDGIKVEIHTKQNEKLLEFKGMDAFVDVHGN